MSHTFALFTSIDVNAPPVWVSQHRRSGSIEQVIKTFIFFYFHASVRLINGDTQVISVCVGSVFLHISWDFSFFIYIFFPPSIHIHPHTNAQECQKNSGFLKIACHGRTFKIIINFFQLGFQSCRISECDSCFVIPFHLSFENLCCN